MPLIHNNQNLKDRRRELRRNATPQEEILWQELRNNKLGFKFKRQHSIGGYILDFYCSEKKLIVEVDGGIHNTKEAREYDEARDKFFTSLDYKVLRVLNREVEINLKEVLEKIRKYLEN